MRSDRPWFCTAVAAGALNEFRNAGSNRKVATPLRALIVEHSHHDIDSMLFELRECGFLVEHTLVETEEDFRTALAGNDFDVVLADYRPPNWSALDALQELRRTGNDIPFLLVSGEEAAVECIKLGASDYVLKDHLSRLPVALMRAMQKFEWCLRAVIPPIQK
jgi:DNA-binding NtrC family response regulator